MVRTGNTGRLHARCDPGSGARRSLPLAAAAFVAFVCLALAGVEVWREYLAYNADLAESEAHTQNLAQSLAQHAEDTVEMADGVLGGIVERLENEELTPAAIERLNRHLAAQVRDLPRLQGLYVYDDEGRWSARSSSGSVELASIADRTFFRRHASSPDLGPYVGEPIADRSGQWIMTVSRRLQRPDGTFAGVAAAAVDVSYFLDFYRTFDVGPNGTIALFRGDGILMVRSPSDVGLIGRSFASSPAIKAAAISRTGNARYTSSVDGVERLSAFQRTSRYPLLLLVAMAKDDALAQWYTQSKLRGVGVSFLILLVALAGLRLADQARQRDRSESALVESEERFRLLAENSSDMVTRVDRQGCRNYVSPASRKVLGRAPDELEGRPVFDAIYPEDQKRVRELLRKLRQGEADEAVVEYRTFHADGRELWLESSVHVARDPRTGVPDGVVAVTRDISERKALELKLMGLARTDGLTGLTNRRGFDEGFANEWRRTDRAGAPLSLVLVDVDRFKVFNDAYGHQAGDECLRVVAGAVAAQARRPGDIVARYGGEEIVLVLPSTDGSGAEILAERVRVAIQALALRHEGNVPAGVVTVSIGVATVTAAQRKLGSPGPDQLVEAADQALYRAKAGGRNRVVVAPARVGHRSTAAA